MRCTITLSQSEISSTCSERGRTDFFRRNYPAGEDPNGKQREKKEETNHHFLCPRPCAGGLCRRSVPGEQTGAGDRGSDGESEPAYYHGDRDGDGKNPTGGP